MTSVDVGDDGEEPLRDVTAGARRSERVARDLDELRGTEQLEELQGRRSAHTEKWCVEF